MHRYEELEKRYYRKQLIKWGVVMGVVLVGAGIGFYLYKTGKLGGLKQFGIETAHRIANPVTPPLKPIIEIKEVKVDQPVKNPLPPPPKIGESGSTQIPGKKGPGKESEGNKEGNKSVDKNLSINSPQGTQANPQSQNRFQNSFSTSTTSSLPVLSFQLPKEPPQMLLSPPVEMAASPKPVRQGGEVVHRIVTTPMREVQLRSKPVSPMTETVKAPFYSSSPAIKGFRASHSPSPHPGRIVEKSLNVSELIQNYNENPNYDTAILIAQTFLREGNLYLAKIWALKANNINVQRPESWIIFAKVLLRKGYREDAIKVLKTYIEDYGYNDKVDQLLQQIKGGE